MSAFWTFARRMLRYRLLLGGSAVMVLGASASLGVGILGASPVLRIMLSDPRGLDALVPEWWAFARGLIPSLPGLDPALVQRLPSDPRHTLAWILGALATLTILGSIATFLHAYFAQTVVNRTVTRVRREAFGRVLRAPLRDVLAAGPTDAISRIVNDSTQLANGLSMVLSKAVLQIFKGVAGLAAALALDAGLTLGALLVAPLLYLVIRKLGKRIRRASRAALASQAGLYATAAEALQALRVVKVHTTENYESGRFHRVNKEMLRELNRVRTSRALASPLTEAMTIFVLCGLVLVAGHLILQAKVNPDDFIMVLAALAVAGASLKPLTGIINDIQASAPAADRLMALLNEPEEPGHERGLPRLSRHAGSIELRDIRFSYPASGRAVLDGISLTIKHGMRVAIVGANGSGKTTLLALIPRLFDPDAGQVLIDGHDIKNVAVRSLRAQIGMVTQEVVLFRGTIASNIAYGTSADHDAIVGAAKRARAHDFISAMPLGYDTPVAEQGTSLSGGQRQRIAIARAILRDPAILILDEATSMVDAESEAEIAAAIREFVIGRTCLIVAHRLSTVMNADEIVVLDAGRVIDRGTHADLMARCDLYQALAKTQFFGEA
jgi:ATP-binding cassette, subfamily B, bacterial MsbA